MYYTKDRKITFKFSEKELSMSRPMNESRSIDQGL